MEALILSCSTGGGHNAAGRAVKEELERRGHHAVMLDPYSLAGKHWDRRVGNAYIRLVQESPQLFGCIYQLGDWYRQLPIHSPVYKANQLMCRIMEDYLEAHPCDVILMPHIYPGEILTNMKDRGISVPPAIYISTDYTCIPFTEEISCDYFITPSPEAGREFMLRGIPSEKLIPAGIPVGKDFLIERTPQEAKNNTCFSWAAVSVQEKSPERFGFSPPIWTQRTGGSSLSSAAATESFWMSFRSSMEKINGSPLWQTPTRSRCI